MTEAMEHFEERAAVRQYDGGASIEDAETLAIGDVAIKYGWPAAVGLSKQPIGDDNGRP